MVATVFTFASLRRFSGSEPSVSCCAHRAVRAVLLGVSLFAAPSVWAQSEAADVSLKQVWQSVLERQPEQAILSGYAELSNRYRQTSESWFPEGARAQLSHENDAITDDTGYQSWEAGLSFPIGLGEQREAYRELGARFQDREAVHQSLLKWQASGLTRQLVWTLRQADVEWQRRQQNLGLVSALVEKVRKAVEAGESPAMDLVLARKARLNVEKTALEAKNRHQQALEHYRYWSGLSRLPLVVTEPVEGIDGNSKGTLDNHPKWRWAESRLKQLEARRNLARAGNRAKPELFVGGHTEQDDQTAARTSLIMEISVPLGQPARYHADMAEQEQGVREQLAEVKKVRQALENHLREARQALQQSRSLLEITRQQVDLSETALRTAEQAYDVGEIPIQTLLNVQSQTLQALLDHELQQVKVGHAQALYRQALGLSL